jgi:hypothetical protein
VNGEVIAVGMAVAINGNLLTIRILVVMMLMSMFDYLKMPCMHACKRRTFVIV